MSRPELVSSRIQRFVQVVGQENVIASIECGLVYGATRQSPGRS